MVKQTFKLLISLGFILSSISASPTNISAPPYSESSPNLPKENLKSIFGHCLHKKDVVKCLKRRVVDVIDDVTQSNDPLSTSFLNLQFSLNKNSQFKVKPEESDSSRTFEDVLSLKLKNLLESRLIQVKVTDDMKEDVDVSAAKGLGEEARKKKGGGGGKHGGMMAGIGIMAFMAQLFLSKVAFMSGAALLLAKIALLFSALTSLKKSSGSSGGGEHVVYAADVGKQGWQRSIHTMSPVVAQQQQSQISDDLPYHGHSTMPSYDGV